MGVAIAGGVVLGAKKIVIPLAKKTSNLALKVKKAKKLEKRGLEEHGHDMHVKDVKKFVDSIRKDSKKREETTRWFFLSKSTLRDIRKRSSCKIDQLKVLKYLITNRLIQKQNAYVAKEADHVGYYHYCLQHQGHRHTLIPPILS